MTPRLSIAVALLIGMAYVFVTPPFEVPDEQNHFWRSLAIGGGQLMPGRGGLGTASIVKSTQSFAWVLVRTEPRQTLAQRLRIAAALPYDGSAGRTVRFVAPYTPLPYAAQSLVAALPLRPMIVFYGGRVANLVLAVMLIGLAIRAAPRYGSLFAAAALLPMSFYELASLSADAATIALSLLFTALLLVPPRRTSAVVLTGFLLALCKPAYFLIALLVLVIPFRWRDRIAVIAAVTVGTVVALFAANRGAYNLRPSLPIDAAAQIRCIAAGPVHFVRVIANDLVTNGRYYAEEMIGRFGANELKLPLFVMAIEGALLIAVAATTVPALRGRVRMVVLGIVAATCGGILLSQYLNWSIVCGETIEGVQGRYFLEILPLFLAAISLPRTRWRVGPWVIVAVAVVCNAAALHTLVQRYW